MKRRVEGLRLECRRCGCMKPRGAFDNDRSRPPINKSYWCKECLKPYKSATNARRRKAPGRGYTGSDVLRLLRQQNGRCAHCGRPVWVVFHIDHIRPLSKGGYNEPSNLAILCPSCNLRKGSKLGWTGDVQEARSDARIEREDVSHSGVHQLDVVKI